MKKARILFLSTSAILSLAILLLLPFFSQSNSFQVKAQCEFEGGSCYPTNYSCSGGAGSPLMCDSGFKCYFGGTCTAPTGPGAGCPSGSINTALGCFYAQTPRVFIIILLRVAAGLGGGIAFILMVYAGFMIMTSSGDPKRLTAGKELLTAAIASFNRS
jgi:hypothetical protein